jgi:hypothetical protein
LVRADEGNLPAIPYNEGAPAMSGFAESVRSTSASLSLGELLQQPVSELLGVGSGAEAALQDIGVRTIFDLGSSSVFASASAVLAAGASSLKSLATDVLDDSAPPVPVGEAGALPIEHLRGVSSAQAAALSAALNVATIREFALWPPRQLAHRLVGIAAGNSLDQLGEETAEELRPRFGEYPTERVYYDTLVMFGTRQDGNLTPFTEPLSLGKLTDPAIGFGTPAIGAVATYSQSWFAQGVTLGHMVHSLALAPGEATRIAVVDWSRRTRTSASESVEEAEQLDSSMIHARAVSEVQNAVADEMQSGGSIATGWAKSTSTGSNYGGSIGGGIAGTIGKATGVLGFGFGGSKSSQQSETSSRATSSSWSVGSRSVMAEMNQRVNDRTEQHSTSVRNRRASAVREVSQSEHEQVSTRIVANYNHMHALTIQYYEVVQVYRVCVRLNQFVRALFVPFEMLDFSTADAMEKVARFRGPLLEAALTPRAAELLLDDRGRVEVRSAVRVPVALDVRALSDIRLTAAVARMAGASPAGVGAAPVAGTMAHAGDESIPPGTDSTARAITRLSSVRAGPIEEVVPGDAKLVSIAFEDVGIERVRVDQAGVAAESSTFVVPSTTDQVDFGNVILLRSIQGIQVARNGDATREGSMILRYESDGHPSIAEVPLSLVDGERMQKVAFINADTADRRAELLAHLQSNRGHYTRAIVESLDSASLVQLLAGLSWQDKPLADQIEPRPVAVTGNYLVLRAPAEDDEPSGFDDNQTWGDLLTEREIDFRKEDTRLVPIPTGGVFAEAVLGRSNSAEKLDITRFWNWQDSPIPMQPPEIAPVATGSRGTVDDLRPGALGAPVVNLMAPTTLPESAGLSAVLGAVASGGMFRDMSGLAGTQATAQAASAGTLAAATEAGRIASENFKAVTAQATEMGKAAAEMWKVKNSPKSDAKGNSTSAKPGGISGEGARINHGKDLDKRGVPGTSAPAGTQKPRIIGESRPIFASASETNPSASSFSRELASFDESVGASPQMLGATTAALGSAALGGQGLASFFTPLTTAGGTASSFAQKILETIALAIIRADSQRAGVAQGAVLLPMRMHDNHADFEAVGYAAWTNSAQHIYVNIPLFIDNYREQVANGSTPDDAIGVVRAMTVLMVRHEEEHVQQFTSSGQPPAKFSDMVDFEEQAYANDVTWLGSASVQSFMLNDLGVDQSFIDDLKSGAQANKNIMTGLKTNPPADLRLKMKAEGMIPQQIGQKVNYDIADMYKTTPP